ncbi:extensin-like [Limulus polyphemus]|uniref:Extensin-like n=1 Tax=Limulus polyphemus TaxID=6850 RepID=A0ABM1TRM9_LIMPO|nr:extensin-like [Limulus polyphemus]
MFFLEGIPKEPQFPLLAFHSLLRFSGHRTSGNIHYKKKALDLEVLLRLFIILIFDIDKTLLASHLVTDNGFNMRDSGKLTRNGAEVSITDTGQSCLREDGTHSYGINFIRNTTCSRNPLASDFSTRPFWRPYGIPSSEQSLTVSPSLIPNTWVWNPSNLNHPTQPNIQDSPYERSRSYVTQRHHNDLLYKSQPTRPPWRPTYVNNPPDADPVNRPQPSRPPWKPTYINNPPHADPAYGPQPSSPPWRPTYINNPPHADPAYGPRPSRPPWRPTYLNNPPHADPSYGPQPSRPPWRPTYVNNPPDADPANRPQPSSPPWRSTYLNNPPHADPAYGPQPSGPPWRPPYLNNPPHADPAYRPQPTRPPWRPTYINNPPDTDPVYRPQPSRPPLRPTYVNNPPHTDPANRPQPSRLPWRPSRVTQPSGKEDPIQQTRQHWKPSLVRHPEPSDRRPPNNQWTKNSYQYPGGPFRFTTPSWRPITGRPRSERNNESVSLVSASHLLRTLCVIYLVIFGRHVDLL